jgi:hypothetical protein
MTRSKGIYLPSEQKLDFAAKATQTKLSWYGNLWIKYLKYKIAKFSTYLNNEKVLVVFIKFASKNKVT